MDVRKEEFNQPWKDRVAKFKKSPEATFKDQIQFDMETRAIFDIISHKDERILDIGCGNGATLEKIIALGASPEAVMGCDIVDDSIKVAAELIPDSDFFEMDISVEDSSGWQRIKAFRPTVVILKRILCNLSGREVQRRALCEICACMPKNGRIIMIEPMVEGLQKLNVLRYIMGLEPLKEPTFNEYLRWGDIRYCLDQSSFVKIDKVDYSSTYYIGSRVLQPFLWPDVEPDYDHPINEYFSKLPNREGFGLHWLITGEKE